MKHIMISEAIDIGQYPTEVTRQIGCVKYLPIHLA